MKVSAGLIMFKFDCGVPKFFIVHPGGPIWAAKDVGVWSIPKGEVDATDTDLLVTAIREFVEETGWTPKGEYIPLGTITQKSGKVVHAWGFESDYDPTTMKCNEIEINHPRGSGNKITIPEVDRGRILHHW